MEAWFYAFSYSLPSPPGTVELTQNEEITDVYVCHVVEIVSFYVQRIGEEYSVREDHLQFVTCTGVLCRTYSSSGFCHLHVSISGQAGGDEQENE